MSLIRYIKAMVTFASHQPWVREPEWTMADANALAMYLKSPSGVKLMDTLRNTNLRQQEKSLASPGNMQWEAGYCTGQKAAIVFVESLSDPKNTKEFSEDGEHDADQPTNL